MLERYIRYFYCWTSVFFFRTGLGSICIHHTFRHHVTIKAHHDVFYFNSSSIHTTQRCIVEVGPPFLRVAIPQEPPFITVTGFCRGKWPCSVCSHIVLTEAAAPTQRAQLWSSETNSEKTDQSNIPHLFGGPNSKSYNDNGSVIGRDGWTSRWRSSILHKNEQ